LIYTLPKRLKILKGSDPHNILKLMQFSWEGQALTMSVCDAV